MADLKIVLGNKKYSSWSLRPWLALKHTGAPFDEIVIGLDLPTTAAEIARHSPSGRVPVLLHAGLTIWDSLAICEYLNEQFPRAQLWPADAGARALARSACAEMHSGFAALRNALPMRFVERFPAAPLAAEVRADIERICAIWTECRRRHGASGPYLFGAFSIADAMYGPVVSRFKTYAVPLQGAAAAYADALWSHPAMQEWGAAAEKEDLRAARYEGPRK